MANGNKRKKSNNQMPTVMQRVVVAVILFTIFFYFSGVLKNEPLSLQQPKEISLSEFTNFVSGKQVETAVKKDYTVQGKLKDGMLYKVYITEFDPELTKLMRDNVKDFRVNIANPFFSNFFWPVLFPLIVLMLFWYLLSRSAQAGGGRIMSFGKSRARQFMGGQVKITFNDVAGVDEAKEELQEIIEFLKDPRKFTRLGGKIPKGVLLIGPPGTGKTLLAKAVAGEAGVPFFSISGSDFVEMFVGVGASRVRDLFEEAKRAAKIGGKGCIIFVDEIDAVGRQRFAGVGGGNDEREQTLNALLVEMDGFGTQEGVIVIAATNRPDVLDRALLRPGRFDRVVYITEPDIVGREAILKVHAKNIKLAPEVDMKVIAQRTVGFSGADLANLVNEGALLASRRSKDSVTMDELGESIERVIAGPARKSRIISALEKEITAYHEAGHALLSLLIPKVEPLHKVTILPRGIAGGYTLTAPTEDKYYKSKMELLAEITMAMGGRASEEITFGDVTTGARNDIKVATEMARRMVTEFGMSDKLGNMAFGRRPEQIFLGRDLYEEKNYSDQTALLIDEEEKRIVDECYNRARQALLDNRDKLKALAEKLLEKEVLDAKEIKELLGIK
ncbi:MAG: ATP-dependent zinc metalloprotease FtsH [Candidatus Omnitrophica bacterium]|jgi:cell division protease FtsH|nr:ATP-dependent zinc metalloprotease FtsH [Candidatus Omnitrophota bacterium]